MISLETLSADWIRQQTQALGMRDCAVLERALHAFVLLERLTLTGLPFVFKGGTSLLLRLPKPGRVSVDIDIVCTETQESFDAALMRWVRFPPFLRVEPITRKSDRDPPTRRHYRLPYANTFGTKDAAYVLLDVVEEPCAIDEADIATCPIDCPFLCREGSDSRVLVPTVDALLGDKMTAFAPNTTGVRFRNPLRGEDSSHQVFKQLYDVSQLMASIRDFSVVRRTFLNVVRHEASYKGVEGCPEVVYRDILKTAFDITTFEHRRVRLPKDYEELIRSGIAKMSNDLMSGRDFAIPEARIAAAHAAYLAAAVWHDERDINQFKLSESLRQRMVAHRFSGGLGILDRLKFQPECYYYWTEVERLVPTLERIVC